MSQLSAVIQGVGFGISLGMIYVLVAIGLTVIFGLMDVVNFAHGAFVALGAYAGVAILYLFDNFWVALVGSFLILVLLGMLIERLLIRRLYEYDPLYQLLLTFGLAFLFDGIIRIIAGPGGYSISTPELLKGSPLIFGPIALPPYRLFIIGFALVIGIVIFLAIERSRIGLIIKASIEDRERAKLLGYRLSRINMAVFGLGSGLAALGGVLAGPIFGVNPQIGADFLIISFVIVIVGGLGNIRGTIAAGILFGIIYNVMLFTYPSAADPAIFIAMAAILLVRETEAVPV